MSVVLKIYDFVFRFTDRMDIILCGLVYFAISRVD